MSASRDRVQSHAQRIGWPRTKRKTVRKNFEDDWKALNDVAKSNSENYDKGILTVATIALSLGLVFTKEAALAATLGLKVILVLSWVLLTLSVCSVLYGYSITQSMLNLLKKYGEHAWFSVGDPVTDKEYDRISKLQQSIKSINSAAGVFLSLGLFFSILFSILFVLGVFK
jgi:hypothetical protein